MQTPPSDIVNTLRLGHRELQRLLEHLEQAQGSTETPDREFVRWSYRVEAVQLLIEHPSGNRVALPVATRNISRGGISILHSSYMHIATACEIILTLPGGGRHTVRGQSIRCEHIQGRVHEIGIRFDEPIPSGNLLGIDPLNEAYSLERVEPSHLHGSVLLVTASDLDRDLLLMYLEATSLSINTADTFENAIRRAGRGCDLIVADYHLGRGTGPELIAALREAGADMPVVILTSDKSQGALGAIRESQAAGILSKPITGERLFQALAEFLLAQGDGGPLHSELHAGDRALPLLTKFLVDVPRLAFNLEKALREDDLGAGVEIIRTLSGTGAPLGFPLVSELAIAAERRLAHGEIKDAGAEIRALIVACRRIKAGPAAA